jgi:hypothetical protein
VLEAQEEGQEDGHLVVEPEKRGRLGGFPHVGEVGAEEESVVIVADEPILGEEGALESDKLRSQRQSAFWGRGGDDLGRALVFVHTCGVARDV